MDLKLNIYEEIDSNLIIYGAIFTNSLWTWFFSMRVKLNISSVYSEHNEASLWKWKKKKLNYCIFL